MSFSYMEELPGEALGRYKTKLGLVGLEKCPYKFASDSWTNNPKKWPSLEFPHLYTYLIKSPGLYSRTAMENHKSLEAHNFYVSGWVHTVMHQKVTSTNIILTADVTPSWRVNDEPHKPWIVLNREGRVLAGHCDCMAGVGESCSHVGAILFKVEAAVRLGFTTLACTDVPCLWNQCFTKKVTAKAVTEICFYTKKACERVRSNKKMRKSAPPTATAEDQELLTDLLAITGLPLVGLSAYDEYNEPFRTKKTHTIVQLPQGLRSFFKESNSNLSTKALKTLCTKTSVSVTSLQASYVEEVTLTQSSSSVWHEQRAGRITSSTAHAVCRTSHVDPAAGLIKSICQSQPRAIKTDPIEWGKRYEDDAFHLFKAVRTGETMPSDSTLPSGNIFIVNNREHRACTVRKSGLVICHDKPFLGASPDGIVHCDCCGKGVLELKCPYNQRDEELSQVVCSGGFYLDHNMALRTDHEYYTQVHHQMYVCCANYADVMVWTPKQCIITRVPRDDDFIARMVLAEVNLWKLAILPELLTRKLESATPEQADCDVEILDKDICPCGQGEETGEVMVQCDHCDQWFHLSCLKLKRPPPKNKPWYCKKCRKLKKK